MYVYTFGGNVLVHFWSATVTGQTYSLCKALESTIIYIILVLAHDLGYRMYKRVAVHYMGAHDIETVYKDPIRFVTSLL